MTTKTSAIIAGGLAATCLLTLAGPQPAIAADPDRIDEIVVTAQRRGQDRLDLDGNIDRLDRQLVDAVAHQHIYELLTRVPGVWITRASGQEHLTAIRSPVLTGAGSCGAYLFLEDGIPIRPAGFCNVNSLFEIDTEQAAAIEVIRGPGNALYGANALHGVVNTLMPSPGAARHAGASLELGANQFLRVRAEVPFAADAEWFAAGIYADDGGFRDDSGYRQGKLHLKRRWVGGDDTFVTALTYTWLDQQTAGYIVGEDAYKDPEINRSNADPDAYRKAASLRLYGIWNREFEGVDLDVRPFLRYSDMEFLQHFLPGVPLEENGHVSGGALLSARFGSGQRSAIVGMDLEWSDSFLEEFQADPAEGSDFIVATRPVGKHYDYEVASFGVAPYVQADFSLGERWSIGAGLRLDYLHYDYDNRMLDGNTRDDGTECGFGGCLYTRPADRSDSYTNLAPKLSLGYRASDRTRYYAVLARGFRPPQTTELYRLQSGQETADLDSESVDSLELGWRRVTRTATVDVAAFVMQKRESVFRDAEGFNVSGGRSTHRGIEVGLDWSIGERVRLDADLSYARHRYDFDVVASRGETFTRGNDVDTAPSWLGSLEVDVAATPRLDVALQLTGLGEYYLDAENLYTYPGHLLANLRAKFRLSPRLALTARVNNVMDRDIADRADYAFGDYRYFPGPGREFFAEIAYTPRNESL